MPVYVQHEVLGKVPDVFNAEAIWQAPGLALFSRRPLLRDLLERSPRELRGRAATRCFSHVTLRLAQDEVDDDRHLTRGARVRDLAQSLAALHQKDFGDLLGGDEVRYDVVGADDLAPGEVEVKFGHAVYLPAAGEAPLYRVSASLDGVLWKPVCQIYPAQRLALVGLDDESASHATPGWPFGRDAAVLLVNDGPDAPIEVQPRPKQSLDCAFDAVNGHYVLKARGKEQAARLLLKVARAGAAAEAAPRPAVWKSRSVDDATALPQAARPVENDATYAPLARQGVTLAALALPRLSRYRDTGATMLEIVLDRDLALAPADCDGALRIAIDAADVVRAHTSAGTDTISAPASLTPCDKGAVEIVRTPRALDDRYAALLRLPQPLSSPVNPGARFTFGRSAPTLASLRVLDSPRFLQQADGTQAASADRIGLSRNAFSFELLPAGFQITRLSANQALYHLDDKLDFVAMVTETSILPPGHHLVAGHYVLRFDA
jgi:hypothetical protein